MAELNSVLTVIHRVRGDPTAGAPLSYTLGGGGVVGVPISELSTRGAKMLKRNIDLTRQLQNDQYVSLTMFFVEI